jgi:hypothetical protein
MPVRTPTLPRWQPARRAVLTLFGASLFALVCAAIWFAMARGALVTAYDAVGTQRQAVAEAHARLTEAQMRVRLAAGTKSLVDSAQAMGLIPSAWGERRINVRQSPMDRNAVNHLLADTARVPGRIFGADAFELSVTRAEEGLFDVPVARDQPVMLTLHGALLFRTQGGPP